MTDTQILQLVNINEIQMKAEECIKHLQVYGRNDEKKLGIFLPNVNHHKLQLNEEKYSKLKLFYYNYDQFDIRN